MKNKKLCFGLATSLILTGASAAFADECMSNGTVVLGSKAYSLSYANDIKNQDEIQDAVASSGGKIYVKDFSGNWIDNVTGNTVQTSSIPSVTYKDANGRVTIFLQEMELQQCLYRVMV